MSTAQAPQTDRNRDGRLSAAVTDVIIELDAAEAKFPMRNVPDGTPPYAARMGDTPAREQAERTRDMYRRICETASRNGNLTWAHVLTEEFFEALAESDPAALRAELVQVAAVSLRWIMDLDRRAQFTPYGRDPAGNAINEADEALLSGTPAPLPAPGTPGHDPDVHEAALAQRIREARDQDDTATRPAGADQ